MTPYDYDIEYIAIRVNRGSSTPELYDLTKIFAEINVFESLAVPYITGNLTLADSDGISSLVRFNGTEKLLISLKVGSAVLKKEFFITGMKHYEKTAENDGASAYTLDFVEDKAFLSNFRRLRRSLTGEISDILKSVYKTELDEDLVVYSKSVQNISVVVPNLTALETCIWLTKRATTEYGEPCFLYSTLKAGNQFKSLGDMMSEQLTERTYKYSAAMNNTSNFDSVAHNIVSYNVPYPDDLARISKLGGVKAQYMSIDLLSKQVHDMSFDVVRHHESKLNGSRLGSNTALLFDPSFMIDDARTVVSEESAFVTTVSATSMFGTESYSSEKNPTQHLLKMGRNSDLLFMEKQKITIALPGYTFLNSAEHMTVGRKISIEVPRDEMITNDFDTVDKARSGEYIITHARHCFNALKKYTVSLALGRPTGPS